jgi:hypothetical protein
MGVGWGYGANMLTKYLVEVGESTPLTAAVCIDNPFDLQEATRSYPHNAALDQKLTAGLIDILRANKVLTPYSIPPPPTHALAYLCMMKFHMRTYSMHKSSEKLLQ